MENGPFIDDLPTKHGDFPIIHMVNIASLLTHGIIVASDVRLAGSRTQTSSQRGCWEDPLRKGCRTCAETGAAMTMGIS